MKLSKKLILRAAAGVAAAGVVVYGAASYQAGWDYDPSGTNRALNVNQVVFPDGDKTSGQKSNNGEESELWQKDAAANETNRPQQSSQADYLFADNATPGNSGDNVTANDNQPGQVTTRTADLATGTGANGTAGTVYDVTGDAANADVIINGSAAGNDQNGGSTVPTPTAQPTTPGTNDPTPDPGPAPTTNPSVRPADRVEDPDSSKVMPPTDMGFTNHPYDEDAVSNADDYVLSIWPGSADGVFYRGQKLTEGIIYNALATYVRVGNDVYAWGASDYNKYIRVKGVSFDGGKTWVTEFPVNIPLDIEQGQFVIKMEYRFTQDGEWQDYLVGGTDDMQVQVADSRVIVLKNRLAEDSAKLDSADILLDSATLNSAVGRTVNLLSLLDKYLPNGQLTTLFPGWTENDELVPWFYPISYGRHVLEPADSVDFDFDSFYVEKSLYWLNNDGEVDSAGTNLAYLQTLTSYTGPAETLEDGATYVEHLEVPEYVQAVDTPHYPYLSVDYLDLPDSVLYVDTTGVKDITDDDWLYDRGLQVAKGYTVDDDNPRYTAVDGLLYSKDGTELLGIPTETTELTIPAEVTSVTIPYRSSLKKLTLEGDDLDLLPTVNYAQMPRGGEVLLNGDLLDDYLVREHTMLENSRLKVAAVDDPEHVILVQGDYALTEDGALHLVLTDAARWLRLPDSVTGLEAGSLSDIDNLEAVLLPADGTPVTFEDGWADDSTLKMIGCYTKTQYEAARAAAPEGVEVLLMGDAVDGYTYLQGDDGSVVLLDVPDDITEFDGTVPAADGSTLTVTTIADAAFRGCYSLVWVDLPQETTTISYQAFKDCISLQGVMINTTDPILIEAAAFDGCTGLRFVASNSGYGDVRDDFAVVTANYNSALYAPTGAPGYTGNWISFTVESNVTSYQMVDCGGTRVLYGCTDDSPWLALRSGTDVTGPVSLPMGTVEIFSDTFQDAKSADRTCFTVNWDELYSLGYIDSAAFQRSDLGTDVTLPYNMYVDTSAFASCQAMTSFVMPGWNLTLGYEVFSGCTNLQAVTFGSFAYGVGLRSGTFNGCESLSDITFTDFEPVDLILYNYGNPFRFNADDWNAAEDEEAHIHLHVPESNQLDYLESWRYAFAGYNDSPADGTTAYQLMWRDIYNEMFDYDNWIAPDINEVNAELDRRLISAENHARRLLGMPDSGEVTRKFTYVTDELGYMTLTGAVGITYTSLSAEELELPEGWFIDYIGADAFAQSPDLRTVMLPDTLSGIYANAFRGVTFTEPDPDDPWGGWGWDDEYLYLYYASELPYELLGFEDGTPFSFGVDDDKVCLVDNTFAEGGVGDDYIQAWTLPMAGYHTVTALRNAVTADLSEGGATPTAEAVDAEVMNRLLAAENRVRTMLSGYDTIESVDDMVFDIDEAMAGEPEWAGDEPEADAIQTPETALPTEDTAEDAADDSGDTDIPAQEIPADATADEPKQEPLNPATPETAAKETIGE